MKTFAQYVKYRNKKLLEDDSSSNSLAGLGDIGSAVGASDDCLVKIAKLAIRKHKQDMLSLFSDLASKDNQIQRELDNYNKTNNNGGRQSTPKVPDGDDDVDIVMPSTADGYNGLEDD